MSMENYTQKYMMTLYILHLRLGVQDFIPNTRDHGGARRPGGGLWSAFPRRGRRAPDGLASRGASPPCDAPRDGPSARPTDRRRGPGSARRRGSHAARCKGDVRGELHRQHKGRASGGCVRRASRRRGGVRKVTLLASAMERRGEGRRAEPEGRRRRRLLLDFHTSLVVSCGLSAPDVPPYAVLIPPPRAAEKRRGWQRPARGGHARGPPRAASRPVGPAMVQGSGRAMRGTCAPGQRCLGGPY